MRYYCNVCRKTISQAEFEYSTKNFDKPLCMNCQRIKRSSSARSSSITHTIPSGSKRVEEEQEIDVIGGVEKIVRGVTHVIREASVQRKTDFNKWTADWRRVRKLDFSIESKHFFLGGTDLDDFTKQLIRMAKNTILLANPYLESCYLTDALIDSARQQTEIRIVTRSPEARETKKVECHSKLRKTGVFLRYDNQIHSKIIVVDNKIAIVSSMNFYSGSSGGASKEAGIVSIDERVVESATDYIKRLLDGP
jgi:phosphatidylserine/phosphatidylglycerophosphate/cardiolipin synthase-like enzyme